MPSPIEHPIIVLKLIQMEKDMYFHPKMILDLDKITAPVIVKLRDEWLKDSLTLGGDVIYLFNRNIPRQLSQEERDTPSK